MKQIPINQAEGKAVARVFQNWGDSVLITFTDATFAVIRAVHSYDQVLLEDDALELRSLRSDFGDDVLDESGIASKAGLQAYDREKMARDAARREEQDRQLFERLRAKYGE